MEQQSEIVIRIMGWMDQAVDIALGWMLSPAAWSQFGLLTLAFLAPRFAAGRAVPLIARLVTPAAAQAGMFATARRFALRFLPLLMPVLPTGSPRWAKT